MARKGKLPDGFLDVPSESRLSISVKPADGTVFADALWYQSNDVPDTHVVDLELVPGPWKSRLSDRTVHVLELWLRLIAQTQVTVTARIDPSPSDQSPQEIVWTFSGSSGKRFVKLYVVSKG